MLVAYACGDVGVKVSEMFATFSKEYHPTKVIIPPQENICSTVPATRGYMRGGIIAAEVQYAGVNKFESFIR